MLMMFVSPLVVACGDDDEAERETGQTFIFPTYVFSEGTYWAEGYATPDFTQYRGSIVDGEKNYSFHYEVKLIDEKKYKYEFNLTDGGQTSAYGNAEIVWVTDSRFNFTMQWNDVAKEYDIIDGYFVGGKLENIIKANGGVSVNVGGENHGMALVSQFTISLNDMKVSLGVPR